MFSLLLLALLLVARTMAESLCHNHPGYTTTLKQGIPIKGVLRKYHNPPSKQKRHFCFRATPDENRASVSNLYIKLATCKGTVSVRLFDPLGDEIFMKGRDCDPGSGKHSSRIKYDSNSGDSSNIATYAVPEEHSIWTYYDKSAIPGIYTIVVQAEKTPCGKASFEILASSKEHRQPPVLPDNTCIQHKEKFTTSTSVGLSWKAASLPSDTPYQVLKYCIFLIPTTKHNHTCGSHGSRCSVALLRSKDTVEMCFTNDKPEVTYIVRHLTPNTEYHVDVIVWTYDSERDWDRLPMAYSQSQIITTLPETA